jgi:hypothetical protein
MSWQNVLKAPKGIRLPPDEHDKRHEKRFIREVNYVFRMRLEMAERKMKEKGMTMGDSPYHQELLGLFNEFNADPRKMYEEYKKEYPNRITRFRDFIEAIKTQAHFIGSMIATDEDK